MELKYMTSYLIILYHLHRLRRVEW